MSLLAHDPYPIDLTATNAHGKRIWRTERELPGGVIQVLEDEPDIHLDCEDHPCEECHSNAVDKVMG